MAKQWFAVQTYSGQEQRVKAALEERIRAAGKEELFGPILVPQEKVLETVRGKRRLASRRFFPGYILVNMEMNDDTWHIVRSTPRVIGFVGGDEGGRNPAPLREEEVAEITQQMEAGSARPRARSLVEPGDAVKVISGPFQDLSGVVEEVKAERGKVRVLLKMFGNRSTPVELDTSQVEKA
jgi:transcriptional antiterminator NusG